MILLEGQKNILLSKEFWTKIKKLSKEGKSMRLRLAIFFILFLIILMIAVFTILLATGVFRMGTVKTRALLENELNHISENIYKDYGSVSVKCVDLAKALSLNIERNLKLKNIGIKDLKNHPDALNEILDSECEKLTTALFSTKSSGVFMILDGTINPNLPYADASKAGIYIRNMEPNIINLESPYLHMLVGSTKIAGRYEIKVHSQWALEFNIQDAPYYTNTINTAKNNVSLPLSRLYYWCPNTALPNTTDRVMICSAPLIASDQTVYGVCGFEISALLFKLSYSPDESISDTAFCQLSQIKERKIDCSTSFIASNYSAIARNELSNACLTYHNKNKSLNRYSDSAKSFMGLHEKLTIYPEDSPYNDQEWVVSIMVPERDYNKVLDNIDKKLVLMLIALLIAGIIAAFYFSRFYLKPITETISKMKSIKPSDIEKTNILEIDDLLEFLSRQDNRESRNKILSQSFKVYNTDMFTNFLKNIETLSPAEHAVFNLYMEGHTAKEIAEKLYLSINTIKTHNKRIYEKMNVSSRNELMVYIHMMREFESKGQ